MFKMADAESLTDAELLKRLKQYGETPGPITNSTRSIWVKKLRSLNAGENTLIKKESPKTRGRTRRSTPRATKLAGFSSGEEEDLFTPQHTVSKSKETRDGGKSVNNEKELVDGSDKRVGQRQRGKDSDQTANKSSDKPNDVYTKAYRHINDIKRRTRGYGNNSDINISQNTMHQIRLSPTTNDLDSPGQGEALKVQDRTNQARASRDMNDTPRRIAGSLNHDGNDQEEELYVGFEPNRNEFLDWLLQIPVLIILSTILICIIAVGVYIWSRPTAIPEIEFQGPATKGKVQQFLRCLHEKVGTIVGLADCEDGKTRYLPGKNLEKVARDCFTGQNVDIQGIVRSGLEHAVKAKQQVLKVEDADGNPLKKVLSDTSKLQITTAYAIRPAWCRIRIALWFILTRVLTLLIVLGSAMVTYYSWKRRWMLDDEETREMFILVDHIIDALRKHHEASQHEKELPPYLPIPHVRDMLVPPRERKKKARVWKKAVEFLSSTDSRIRVETQTIAGEDYEVWSWIGVITPNLQQRNDSPNHLGPDLDKGKYWQGPAFVKLEQVVRMPIVTPTPCLKIRCMHGGPSETQDEWDFKIRDALLEKCSEDGAKILHIFVDKVSTEGCVYVKCESLDSAGKAFRSIYANWFDGRLLVVKFVTLKRYHQRFPEALKATAPLEPSGRFPSSLEWFSEDTVD